MKNLVDKKAYRTFITTCFDLNTNASMLNTLELQKRASDNSSTPPTPSLSSPLKGHYQIDSASVNLSPSHLSLIIAAGFNKGEVHVFDGFKKEASIFYNNNVSVLMFIIIIYELIFTCYRPTKKKTLFFSIV